MVLTLVTKKILITGSNGQLAKNILSFDNFNFSFIPTSLHLNANNISLDITDSELVKNTLNKYNPDIIINCAGFTDVNSAYENKKVCHDVNVCGLINLIKYSKKNTKIVHISSDYVFDGNKGVPYIETDLTYPINYYGKTKLEAENILIGSEKNDYLIFRPNVIYSEFGNNFFMFIYNSLKNNKKINVVDDQISNPVFALNLANVILESIVMDLKGIYHYGSTDILSRYEFAIKIANYFNLNSNHINKISSSSLQQQAKRPLNTSLDCSKIRSHLDCALLSSEQSFDRLF